MKNTYLNWLFTAVVFVVLPVSSFASGDTTLVLKVAGNCGMCKERIEKGLKVKGVRNPKYDYNKKVLTVTIDPHVISIEKLHDKIASLGHDTELRKASDEAYARLHDCCRYREAPENMEEVVAVDSISHASTTPLVNAVEAKRVIRGSVFEATATGERALQGASVAWKGSNVNALTDSAGWFSIPLIEGNSQLLVSYVGYPAREVEVKSSENIHITFSSSRELSTVVVSSSRRSSYVDLAEPVRMSVMTQKELLKAACCNLSESFETNPSVDVSFSDAVTGAKQIHLLGLSGNYTQLTVENMPGPRGLATAYGLNSIPGTWVESIQLIKGAGTVINGFESIAGQINVELKKPQTAEQLYANVYTNDWGKTDLNLNLAKKVGKHWSTALLLHDAFATMPMDFNKDGFRDAPTGNLFTAMNRWSYDNTENVEAQFGVRILKDEKVGGDVHYSKKDKEHMAHGAPYGLGIDIDRLEGFGKLGYVFKDKKYQSIGLQLSAFNHEQDSYFGTTNYVAKQQNVYANLIFQSIFNNTAHKYRTGISFSYDKYNETFKTQRFSRKEVVPGAFFEYTFSPNDKFDLVSALRLDHNSLFGAFVTPRLHLRYEPWKGTVIRGSFGRGQRTANILAENNAVFVSSRQLEIVPSNTMGAYGLDPEVSWNKGISLDQKFKLFNRAAMLSVDFFRNDFENQVVVDVENPGKVRFYNLEGKSYSNSYQAELSFEPVKALTAKVAYRYYDVKTTYGKQLLQKPFTAAHRTFANLAYETKGWKFDYTVSHNGSKRIPSTATNPAAYRMPASSPSYVMMNAQVTKTFGKKKSFDVYIGGENLTNFFQEAVIIAADQPYSQHFDASMVWGPIGGRMFYVGARFKIL